MEENTAREWITLRDMQEVLGIGSTKAYSLVASGEVPSVRIGRAIRISRKELEHWLEERRYSSTVESSLR